MTDLKRLLCFFKQYKNVAVAYSGGVDSTVICAAAKLSGASVLAIYADSKLNATSEKELAQKTISSLDIPLLIVPIDVLSDDKIMQNPFDRCYICKSKIFTSIREMAAENGFVTLFDGTNTDDLKKYRPGMKAKDELNVISPLAELGFTKEQVRSLAKEMNLSVFSKPSLPCYMTRFPYETKITEALLKTVEKAEKFLLQLGIQECRVRVHNNIARIEVNKDDFSIVLENKEKITNEFKNLGYSYIVLDLEGFRSGSMDIDIKQNFN